MCNSKTSWAQNFSGPAAAATGGAGRAAALGPESHYLNPASIALADDYHIGYFYRYQDYPIDFDQRDWSLLAVDSHQEVLVPAGFSYVSTERSTFGRQTSEEDYQLSIAGRLHERLVVGVYGRAWVERPRGGSEDSVFQLGLGTVVAALEWLNIGFVAYNILDEHRDVVKPELALAFQAGYQDLFRYRLDIIYPEKDNPDKKGVIMTGGETFFTNGLRGRFGARFDDIQKNTFATAGVGFEGPRLALDYSYEQDTRKNEHYRQTFDLRLHF